MISPEYMKKLQEEDKYIYSLTIPKQTLNGRDIKVDVDYYPFLKQAEKANKALSNIGVQSYITKVSSRLFYTKEKP